MRRFGAVPAISSVFLSGIIREIAVYIAWVNSIIAASDIINSVLIAIKPKDSLFYRGYYKITAVSQTKSKRM